MGTSPVPRSPREYRTLTKAELCFLVRDRPRFPLLHKCLEQAFRTSRAKKRKPRPLGSRGRSFASFGRMGDVNPSALHAQDAHTSDRESMSCEVIASTKRLKFRDGFALSPIRAVFLDSSRWVVEPTVKLLVMRLFTFVPHLLPRCLKRSFASSACVF